MSTAVVPERLRHELAARGMAAIDLARKAGLSPATVSAALAGRPISEASLRLMARVLQATPVDEFINRLLEPIDRTSTGDVPFEPMHR